jgi:hypothetical protein
MCLQVVIFVYLLTFNDAVHFCYHLNGVFGVKEHRDILRVKYEGRTESNEHIYPTMKWRYTYKIDDVRKL